VPYSPAATLVVSCSGAKLTLINVLEQHGKVFVQGAAAHELAGQQVTIEFAPKTKVGTTRVGANGFFQTTVPLPPKDVRNTSRARYIAVVKTFVSKALKLTRRVTMNPLVHKGGKVLISGKVLPPLARPTAKVNVTQQLTCKDKPKVVGTAKPSRSGGFVLSIPVPKGQKAAIYRVITKVRGTPTSAKTFPSFSLPLPVDLS